MSLQRGDYPLHMGLYFRPETRRSVLLLLVVIFGVSKVDPLEARIGGWYTITLSR